VSLFRGGPLRRSHSKRVWLNSDADSGFALLEVVVALVIMTLVGLMAWRGMDAMIRGREVIDRRANQDADYSQLVRQFEKDCQSVLVRDELSSLANSQAGGGASASSTSAVAAGAKNIWFLRRYRADNVDAWLIAGYGMGPTGLQRWTSKPLLQRAEAGTLWFGISRDPDLASSDLLLSLEVPTVVRQSFRVQTSVLSGAGSSGISTSGTGSPNSANAANATNTTNPSNPTASTNTGGSSNAAANLSNLLPEQQGVVMQWWIKDVALPITRSCLMGGAL
jgi:type II secretory pathway pseudopilin PulG